MEAGPLDAAKTCGQGTWDGIEVLIVCSDGRTVGYNPTRNSWRSLPPDPAGYRDMDAPVWDGRELLVCGGRDHQGNATAASTALDPAAGRWRTLSSAPLARAGVAAVWTGKVLLEWGGQTSTPDHAAHAHADGAAFDPITNRWSPLPPAPLAPRYNSTALWTGSTFVVWGGQGTPTLYGDGATFDPATSSWMLMPAGPLGPRVGASAFWDGQHMLLWGDANDSGVTSKGGYGGAIFLPETRQWASLPPAPLSPRGGAAVWTGTELVTWGGADHHGSIGGTFDDGARYVPTS